jgi:hypothetical protein
MASPLSNPNSQGARSERDYLDLLAGLFRQHGWRVKKEPKPPTRKWISSSHAATTDTS